MRLFWLTSVGAQLSKWEPQCSLWACLKASPAGTRVGWQLLLLQQLGQGGVNHPCFTLACCSLCCGIRTPVSTHSRRRAQEIEPGYCEPTYWRGLTTFNMGRDPLGGVATMKASLSCKYSANEALQALNKVFVALMEAAGGSDPAPMLVRAACVVLEGWDV